MRLGAVFLLDHVGGVGSGAAAAVRAEQTADVSRVVSREVGRVGSTLQTDQPLFITRGTPEETSRGTRSQLSHHSVSVAKVTAV